MSPRANRLTGIFGSIHPSGERSHVPTEITPAAWAIQP